jgi:hypothetical protein
MDDLTGPLEKSRWTISRYLRVLCAAGLGCEERRGNLSLVERASLSRLRTALKS